MPKPQHRVFFRFFQENSYSLQAGYSFIKTYFC